MPIVNSIDHDKALTIHTVTGEPLFEEIIAAVKQFYESKPTKNVLWDLRKASLVHVSYAELRKILDYVSPMAEKRAGGKTALVGTKDLEFAMSRTFKTFSEIGNLPFQVEAFRSIEEANQWLDEED
jgi:hypothetical protein